MEETWNMTPSPRFASLTGPLPVGRGWEQKIIVCLDREPRKSRHRSMLRLG